MKTLTQSALVLIASSLLWNENRLTSCDAFSVQQGPTSCSTTRSLVQRQVALIDSDASSPFFRDASAGVVENQQQQQRRRFRRFRTAPVLTTSAPITTPLSLVTSSSTLSSLTASPTQMDPLEVPRHREADIAKARAIMQLEMVLGRVAMVAAVLLFLGEITTGQSLPDQMTSWLVL